MATKTEMIRFRLRPEVRAAAEKAAAADGRTLSNWLEKLLIDNLPSLKKVKP